MKTLNWNKHAAMGAVYAGLAVALGAFGAHGLEGTITAERLATYETAARYQMYHALGLLLVALLAGRLPAASKFAWACRLLHAGIWLFSGSLYALVLSDVSALGAITPLGGLCWIAAWVLTAAGLWSGARSDNPR